MHLTPRTVYEGTLYCGLAALGVYALWIEPYLRRHLIKPSPFFLFLLAPILDYLKVRKVCRRRKQTPWFIRVYEILLALTTMGLIASAVVFVVARFKASS